MTPEQRKATSHTQGPWNVGPWFDNYGEPELVIEHKTDAGNLVVAVALGGLVGQEANAHLIAAAPDLLEALKGILSAVTFNDGRAEIHLAARSNEIKKAHAAIAKAEAANG